MSISGFRQQNQINKNDDRLKLYIFVSYLVAVILKYITKSLSHRNQREGHRSYTMINFQHSWTILFDQLLYRTPTINTNIIPFGLIPLLLNTGYN